MEFYIYLCFAFAGAAIGLVTGYMWRGWEDKHSWQAETSHTQGAAYDACEDEPEPKRATSISAIHCMDQIDALLERL